MARLVIVGDIHDEQERLKRTLDMLPERPVDLVLLAGDVGQDPPWEPPARRTGRAAHDRSVRQVLRLVHDHFGAPVLFVPGNHDLSDPPEDVAGLNVDRRTTDVAGVRVAGLGGAGPHRFGFPYEWTEAQADAALSELFAEQAGQVDVFLCHTPPARTSLDRMANRRHVGSESVSTWIARARPRLFVCGHIHEAPGLESVHDVPCLNAGALGEPYGQEIVWTIEWDRRPNQVECWRRDARAGVVHEAWHP